MADPFTLQAHITDACDLECRHCYRQERRKDLDLAAWEGIVRGFTAFCERRRMAGRITFAGGEPLLRFGDLRVLMEQARAAGHQVHLLTNGIRLTAERARELAGAGCLRVQVSLDGDAVAHEAMRGAGTYAAALEGLRQAQAAGMAITISMTVDQNNVEAVGHVAEVARNLGAKLYVSRLVPCGRGAARMGQLLSAERWREVMQVCAREAQRSCGSVALRDPLYGRLNEEAEGDASGRVGGCACGYGGLAVEADGEAYPCRRLPMSLGNLAGGGWEEIWASPLLERLRDRDLLKGACGRCGWRWQCGGCRAVAWADTGDVMASDPQCAWAPSGWRRFTELRILRMQGL